MGTIRDIHTPWRDALLPAMFDGVPFHVESGARESGRRTVVHEFPKRDFPYSEDMGQVAVQYNVRGYVISFMNDSGMLTTNTVFNNLPVPSGGLAKSLYMRDYRIARDLLQQRLDTGGEGVLQLPYMARAAQGDLLTITAVCTRYRMTEEDRFGGFAVFEMSFVDYGTKPPITPSAITALAQNADNTYHLITEKLTPDTAPAQVGFEQFQ